MKLRPCEAYGKKLIVDAIMKHYNISRQKAVSIATKFKEKIYGDLEWCRLADDPSHADEFIEQMEHACLCN